MKQTLIQIGLPGEMLERIERYTKACAEDHPGWNVPRTAAIRSLIDRALTELGYAKTTVKKQGTR